MKHSNKRFVSIIVALLMLAGSLIVYSILIKDTYSDIQNLRGEVTSRLNIIDKNQGSVQQVQKLLSDYQQVADIKRVASMILPTDQDVPQAVNQISELAKSNNLKMEVLAVQQLAIKPSSQPGVTKGIGTLRFNLRLSGSYDGLKGFLQNVENNINLMDIVSFKVSPVKEGGAGSNVYSFTATLDRYYQAE
jgi:Tfp pilus assembly protein PilO